MSEHDDPVIFEQPMILKLMQIHLCQFGRVAPLTFPFFKSQLPMQLTLGELQDY